MSLPLPKKVFNLGDPQPCSIRIAPAMRASLEELAAQNGVKFATYVAAVLEDHLQKELNKGSIQPPKPPARKR